MISEKTEPSVIMQYYAAIARQSESMLAAAKEGDWDALCTAEEICSQLIAELQSMKANTAPLSDQERQKHIAYLKKILADDAQIRNITEPRLAQLEELLRSASNNQRLNQSYGA